LEIGEQPFFVDDLVTVDGEANEVLGLVAADEQAALPRGKQIAGVRGRAG
jgi:hypothetical protein